ncbi:potassium/sodium efflux P-type ATPase, fungal-type [Blastomyces dermatitidis ER-3]|uniref:P-type Na(+) transporter n=1 Tax=Ajellomyces dermatitidis (strain ER-3 / ATCC MYA-2586) TaxID=559297 RepID=A0ABM9YIE9_AJEDR|nr:potassium/sodium efflux P-type ATPase, fungal-type [Blastomyces dermatitidis ER-3]EEQ91163.1 potassium/sodium efflux P-type ATPase, fungal-type [Blastomyces dermatitidis ER-3]
MGIETSPPDVEESTEPPSRSSIHEGHQQHSGSALNQSASTNRRLDEIEKVSKSPGTALSVNFTATSTLDELQKCQEICEHAYSYPVSEVSRALGVDLQHGLSCTEAASRLERDGPNKVKGAEGVSLWKILLRQVSNSLTLVLVITMALSFGINDYIEGAVITAVILLNIVVGFVQDYRAEKTILSLQALSAPVSKVVRDGRIESVKAETLVVGDVVQLAVGDMIPADLRLFDGMNASTDEALLTGESLPVSKNHHLVFPSREMAVGDRTNMAYSGSTMTQGRAAGIVIATAMDTEVGKIAQLLRQQGPKVVAGSNVVRRTLNRVKSTLVHILGLVGTPLQVKLSKFALILFALAIMLAIIVFSANEWDVHGEVLIYGICVAVAVIPESLIAVLTITVAVGTKAMAKGNVVVRKLQALEAVGGVTNICSDKTGTLTQGRMIARKAWVPDAGTLTVHDTTNPFDPRSGFVQMDGTNIDTDHVGSNSNFSTFLKAIALCNLSSVYNSNDKASIDNQSVTDAGDNWTAVGEPTEIALHVLALRFNSGKLALLQGQQRKQLAEFPFDSAIKRMTVVYQDSKCKFAEAFAKGAAESMLPLLRASDEKKAEIRYTVDSMAGEGLRVLCVAHKIIPETEFGQLSLRQSTEQDLEFIGLVGLYDPPRVETPGAVRKCHMAGITVHMLTGDHIKTATAIAYEVGILGNIIPSAQASTVVMGAEQFDKLSDEEIDAIEALPLVIARCSPTTKVRMVEAMHRRHAFCVMTGDGVNDSPALKHADVGIAMGKNGSDVAKEAADMVLTDDDFASVVKAVEEGRRLFDNIQKFLMHLLISNIAQVILLLLALTFKDADENSVFPLSPIQILWVNLITSSFLALGLGLEESQPDIMYRPPHNLRVGVFTRELIMDKMIYGTFMGSLCLLTFVAVVYGAGSGNLGDNCNQGWNPKCNVVFRARATTYATITFLLLVTAWEVKHFTRSLFNLDPARYSGPFSIFPVLWRNRFLFWAVCAGVVIVFPVVYLPVVNKSVFKHSGITWEWGIVFGAVAVYLALVESWKAIKRAFGIGSARVKVLTMEEAEMRVGMFPNGTPTLPPRGETAEK